MKAYSRVHNVEIHILLSWSVCKMTSKRIISVLNTYLRSMPSKKQLWMSGQRNGFALHRSRVQDLVGTVAYTF